jgi:hypothetical protein
MDIVSPFDFKLVYDRPNTSPIEFTFHFENVANHKVNGYVDVCTNKIKNGYTSYSPGGTLDKPEILTFIFTKDGVEYFLWCSVTGSTAVGPFVVLSKHAHIEAPEPGETGTGSGSQVTLVNSDQRALTENNFRNHQPVKQLKWTITFDSTLEG